MDFLLVVKLLLLCGLSLVSAIPASGVVTSGTGAQIAAYFKEILSTGAEIYLPTDSNFTDETAITQRWNSFSEPTYIVAVKPSTEGDVQKIVSLKHFGHKHPSLGLVTFLLI